MASASGVPGRRPPGERHAHIPTRLSQVPRNHHSIAPVIAGADEHQGTRTGGVRLKDLPGSQKSCALHERVAGDPTGDRPRIGLA